MEYNGTPLQHLEFINYEPTLEDWKLKAEKLWELLDDIDTYFDMFKPDMEAFERRVEDKCQQRHKHLASDGWHLYPTVVKSNETV